MGYRTFARIAFCIILSTAASGLYARTQQRGPTHSPHGALKLRCENCHTETGWQPIRSFPDFNHDKTPFALRGAHAKLDCKSCHTNLVFSNVGTKCADCHADLHRGQFGSRCEECHTVQGWRVSIQDVKEHQNRFPLLGAHAALDCVSCHTGAAVGQFTGLRTDCASCHMTDFLNTSSVIDHKALNFPTTCESCHGTDSWFGAAFNHAAMTGFALTGMHAKLACTACHLNGKFQGTPVDCYSCHMQDFNGTNNPSHVTANFPHDCGTCHTTISWMGATFDHTKSTNFPLTGAHMTVPCASCHINGQFVGTPTDCFSCHKTDFQGTTNPNHPAAGFPTDCSVCHDTVKWADATFDHSKTVFPLTGAHVTVPCASCHINGQFAGTPMDCYSCHTVDYQGTTNPNHASAGFPTTCAVCHDTVKWTDATFDHSKTVFPLTGAHVTVPCASCHINGQFAGTPTDCFSCHKTDYQGTTNPSHTAAGFPTTCATCHTTTSWLGATFTHTWFPIPHHSAQLCSDCHTDPTNYATFTCTTCHTKAQTDPKHQGVSGYVWNSINCYQCHKNGGGGD